MSRLAIAFVMALAATAAHAQDTKSGQSPKPTVGNEHGTQPFLFDGRLPGDGVRKKKERLHDKNPNSGTIIMRPETNEPKRD
ncbi:hypothetical protein Nham_2476 [Nitrobacter hamburgensis X14]|uniref:Uncharacterized protein n=1 Tax=Nitrobacter hamburgensis (strain DSM 10229 / NCIMB 13809 / X14) TaxID=323097 RepID=Q1QKI1_NITHX|nr:hypothetical protein [Nitrobacter hamburgensis]ABE63266.1 hypothetical protein Nham_2476 [Nitrobacter hamburgensis X14]